MSTFNVSVNTAVNLITGKMAMSKDQAAEAATLPCSVTIGHLQVNPDGTLEPATAECRKLVQAAEREQWVKRFGELRVPRALAEAIMAKIRMPAMLEQAWFLMRASGGQQGLPDRFYRDARLIPTRPLVGEALSRLRAMGVL